MPYQTTITEEHDYLRVEITGHRTRGKESEDAIDALSKVAEACLDRGFSRVLIVSNFSGRLPTMSAFNVAENPEKFGWHKKLKMAVVNLSPESKEELLFAETVAVNRGYRFVKIFDDEEVAKRWLLDACAAPD